MYISNIFSKHEVKNTMPSLKGHFVIVSIDTLAFI